MSHSYTLDSFSDVSCMFVVTFPAAGKSTEGGSCDGVERVPDVETGQWAQALELAGCFRASHLRLRVSHSSCLRTGKNKTDLTGL